MTHGLGFSQTARPALIERAACDVHDLLVVGGGVTGAGVAQNAALRGLSVVLLEKGDFASGTSGKTSKLIHGGLRYLQQAQWGLVAESVTERRTLMRIAPHLARPLEFLYPVYDGRSPGRLELAAGLWLYEALGAFRVPAHHRVLGRRAALDLEPGLRGEGLRGAAVYADCATDDARLTLEVARSAHEAGAVLLNHARVEEFVVESGRVAGVRVDDAFGGQFEVRSRAVVVAGGPWTDDLLAASGLPGAARRVLRTTKGIHVVVERSRLPIGRAVVTRTPTDRRVAFCIPWGTHTVVGTTDTDSSEPPETLAATAAEVEYLLATANHHFPGAALEAGDVVSTWAGMRPLIGSVEASASAVSRETAIRRLGRNLLVVYGGKLTIYRRMARRVVDRVLPLLPRSRRTGLARPRTDRLGLPGAGGRQSFLERARPGDRGLPDGAAEHLAGTYGARACEVVRFLDGAGGRRLLVDGLPYVAAEVDHSAAHEMVGTLADFMARRTQILHRTRDGGLGVAAAVAGRLASILGWERGRVVAELDAYRQEVARCKGFRAAPGKGEGMR